MMRGFGAVALILAIIAECLGAQSDRSRQRSGPIRSVPVAADIKRDVDFDCPEEFGYYPHPTDCTLYYVCVFGGALLESCTGGLMYSHELQTCDWPRNVGCDGVSALGGDELERLSERDPPPQERPRQTPAPAPRRNPPPPPPRAQPNPVVTSRGQPKFNREEYEKQQQLYAEVEELPPVEEIESDRQQRVYRGQPSTIGQVQKDRDGYVSQGSSGRTLNSNIIPASIQNTGKLGSFSFGTQVDERRTATATQAPQTYSEDKNENMTDFLHDILQLDIETNEISDLIDKPKPRKKREADTDLGVTSSNSTAIASERSDKDEATEYYEVDEDDDDQDETERGKRQVRYYLKNGHKHPGKNWAIAKPIKFIDLQQSNYNPNIQSARYQQYNSGHNNNNNYYESTRKPYTDIKQQSTANPFYIYQTEGQSQRPFKPSLPDPVSQKIPHNPLNSATQIITKSPPISSLRNNENPFSALAGGFYNNAPNQNRNQQNNNQQYTQTTSTQMSSTSSPNHVSYQDSSLLPSTVVTGKPILLQSSPRPDNKYRIKPEKFQNVAQNQSPRGQLPLRNINDQKQSHKRPSQDEDYEDDSSNEEEDESTEDDSDDFDHDFPPPPKEYQRYKFPEIENPFANPNFDFDAFLSKLSNGQYTSDVRTTSKPIPVSNAPNRIVHPTVEVTTASHPHAGVKSSTLIYKGMSTPKPFTFPSESGNTIRPTQNSINLSSTTKQPQFQQIIQRPQLNNYTPNQQNFAQYQQQPQQQQQQQPQQQQYLISESQYNRGHPQNAGTPLDAVRPKLKPPNFKDDRQLPINYSFNRSIESTLKPINDQIKIKGQNHQIFTVTQKPFVFVTSTGQPILLSSPKNQYLVKPEKIISLQPHLVSTGKPYLVSSIKPHDAYLAIKQSTAKPLTTLANEQLSALQHYWRNKPTESYYLSTPRPNTVSEVPKSEHMFIQNVRPSVQIPLKNVNIYTNIPKTPITTTPRPLKRRPIPKPSPEMNDYYYDEDDDQYYYEPPVKSKYMPSTEVKPQRPPMAQNYKQYDDNESYEDDSQEQSINIKRPLKKPIKYVTFRPETITKNYNDVSIITKTPLKDLMKNVNGKIPIPVLVDYGTPTPTLVTHPETTYKILNQAPHNKTIHIRKPVKIESGPFTQKPPKYLNQTTLRPYTVRHRLAKPTTVKETTDQNDSNKQTRGRTRHPNIVAQMISTTPRDNQNQETRYTKTKNDNKINSLEPTESVTPVSYSASPRPKMLYNGSQSYTPEQYDPYYAVYDEDGELYKDTDYVQQYNTASLRPAVQQTYRGTPPPPPPRRPVETYSPRPVSPDDYDDALIQGQINNQNQYQSPVRHSTRGEGNELGYDTPSSVKTTIFEATSISTTPSTTSTSTTTTTQRSTTALFTEAMTPSRYTPRSSTDENPIRKPEPSSSPNPSSEPTSTSAPTTPSPIINFSSLAKPFKKTDNSNRLKEIVTSTETPPTTRHSPRVTNNNKASSDVNRPVSNENSKKVVSLTTGFSIRRNLNDSNNPYIFTVITRPFDNYDKSRNANKPESSQSKFNKYYYDNGGDGREESADTDIKVSTKEKPSESSLRRKDASPEIISEEDDIPIYVRPRGRIRITTKTTTTPKAVVITSPSSTTKYYLKTALKRPTEFSVNNKQHEDSTENTINTDILIDTALQNAQSSRLSNSQSNNPSNRESFIPKPAFRSENTRNEPVVSPYRTLDNLRSSYNNKDLAQDYYTSSSTARTRFTTSTTTTTSKNILDSNGDTGRSYNSKPSYYSYRVVDDDVPDQTTEVFSGTVKNVIKAFFNNFVSTPIPQILQEYSSTTERTTQKPEEKTVNIGFQKKKLKYVDEKPLRTSVKRLQIVTEPNRFVTPTSNTLSATERDFSSTTTTSFPTTVNPILYQISESTSMMTESSTNGWQNLQRNRDPYESKFSAFKDPYVPKVDAFVTTKPDNDKSRKFQNIINIDPSTERNYHDKTLFNNVDNESTTLTKTNIEATTESEHQKPVSPIMSEIASTTSTTKATTTVKIDPTSTTRSLSFPTRASRVNPAIKLAATNPGGGRRSYQSSSNCSSDNSLQANPKCNEIKYQRPTSTRGRGSAHYTQSASGSDASQQPQAPNRGTPPTRSRPTLKPSTAIVSKSTEFVDIYTHPPSRPAPVYPQPTPDKTAAKCRKDVCLLPDCYCGGKDIPGDLPVEQVPQIVLLTFDDSVNDLNKGLYADLFEKGRVNPNGCPISATFYVSHEWTDYSQVQNLYAAGHEMASHTISHSFGEQFSQKKWNREVGGQREILAAYGGVKLEDVRGMRAPFLSVGGNKMFKMLYDSNFTYDSSLPVYENKPPSWPYTLDYKLFHDCMIPPCPTKSYPGVWEVPMVMWQDLNGGRCSMGDACANPPEAENVYKMILKNFDRHYTSNRAPFGLFYHAAWFTQPHHKEGFIMFLDFINRMPDVWIVTNWQALQWVRDPTPISRLNNFQPFQCNYQDRPKKCNNPKVCNLWHKSGVRYMRTCQPCPEVYPWTGKSGIRSSRIDNDNGE